MEVTAPAVTSRGLTVSGLLGERPAPARRAAGPPIRIRQPACERGSGASEHSRSCANLLKFPPPILVGVGGHQRGVDVQRDPLRCRPVRPGRLPGSTPRLAHGFQAPGVTASITRQAVGSNATSPNRSACSLGTLRSASQSPPSAMLTIRSHTTRPGSWVDRRRRVADIPADTAAVHPSRLSSSCAFQRAGSATEVCTRTGAAAGEASRMEARPPLPRSPPAGHACRSTARPRTRAGSTCRCQARP
jgi:hypothetical protein